MPKYFDPIMQTDSEINLHGDTILYLVRVGSNFSIKGLSSDDLDKLANDPHTLATHYCPINDLEAFLSHVETNHLGDLIFPLGQLTTEPLTVEVVMSLGIHPATDAFLPFSEAVQKQLREDANNDKLTTDALFSMLQDYFLKNITSENRQDLWDAWDELQQEGAVKSATGLAAIAQLDISSLEQENFIYLLTHGVFCFNAHQVDYIKSLFSINKRYPTHFERFAIQVNFEDLLLQSLIEQNEDDEMNSEYTEESSHDTEIYDQDNGPSMLGEEVTEGVFLTRPLPPERNLIRFFSEIAPDVSDHVNASAASAQFR